MMREAERDIFSSALEPRQTTSAWVSSGEIYTDKNSGAKNMSPQLTKRQDDMLKYLVNGLERKEIGEKLDISFETVKNHLARRRANNHEDLETGLFAKLNVHDKLSAVLTAIDLHLVDIPPQIQETAKRIEDLTEGEKNLLELLIDQRGELGSNKEIARRVIPPQKEQSVKNRFTIIFEKLAVRNRIQAGVMYVAYMQQKNM